MPLTDEEQKAADDKAAADKAEADKSKDKPPTTLTIRGKEYTGPQIEQALNYAAGKLQEAKTQLDAATAASKSDDKDDDKDAGKDTKDLDEMTQGELAEHLMGRTAAIVKPVAERVSAESNERVKAAAQTQIKEAAKANPDFWEWETEIRTTLERYPDLQVQEAYILARGANPEKTKEVDDKLRTAAKKEAKAKEPEMLGLLPTSGRTSRNARMNVQDAAESAWEEVGVERHLRSLPGN